MNITVLFASPRPGGNTARLLQPFTEELTAANRVNLLILGFSRRNEISPHPHSKCIPIRPNRKRPLTKDVSGLCVVCF